MNRRHLVLLAAAVIALVGRPALARRAAARPAAAANPLLDPWTGPCGGVPPFDRVALADFRPALVQAMAICRAEIDSIAANPAPATADNTVVALETTGAALSRAVAIFNIYTGTLNDTPMRALEQQMSPLLAAFRDETTQNARLFERLDQARERNRASASAPEKTRLLEVVHRRFTRDGAALDAGAKSQVKQINQRLAALYTRFSQNQLADEEKYTLLLDSESDLAGLPADLCSSAAAAATAAGYGGRWLITNTRSSMEPFITCSSRRDLREKGWRMWVRRGDNDDANDNKAVISEIVRLRGERARSLGFATHAHWVTDDNMARTPQAALALMMRVWSAAVVRAREEIAAMQAVADTEGDNLRIEAWDYRHYAEKVRRSTYDLDDNALKPYLELGRMREAMFWVAGELHGFTFSALRGVPVYHPDVSVYSVRRAGAQVGLWYFDPYARAGKSSGAWMNEYRTQERLRRVLPIVSNNANFIAARPGEPVLISWGDAVTLFHEFGHALHGLSSDVTYPSLAGSAVQGDFVEFPSQLNERWLRTPEVLNRFARHVRTGRPIPAELLAALDRARNFNQGFATVEYLAAAIYDMQIHLAGAQTAIDPARFERDTLAEIGCPREIVMRHRPTHFGHIFAGEGYSAGYYDYLWADTLTADAIEAFEQAGFYDKALARRLHDEILRVGNTLPPEQAYRRFRGRDADADALMRARGFAAR